MPHQTDCLPHQVRRRVVLGSGARRAAHAPDGTLIVSDCLPHQADCIPHAPDGTLIVSDCLPHQADCILMGTGYV
jgi:hypothetical protein